jgi:hypothetical protein
MSINSRNGNTLLESGFFAPCRVATTAALALAGLVAVDGVTLLDGDRVLVKDQVDQITNGIYAASSGNWVHTTDAASNSQFFLGMAVVVAQSPPCGQPPIRPQVIPYSVNHPIGSVWIFSAQSSFLRFNPVSPDEALRAGVVFRHCHRAWHRARRVRGSAPVLSVELRQLDSA